MSEDLLSNHYCQLRSKPFYPKLLDYMTSGPVVVMVNETLFLLFHIISTNRKKKKSCLYSLMVYVTSCFPAGVGGTQCDPVIAHDGGAHEPSRSSGWNRQRRFQCSRQQVASHCMGEFHQICSSKIQDMLTFWTHAEK